MSDTKISALTAAAALSGAEIVPLVQSGATVRTTVSALRRWTYKAAAYTATAGERVAVDTSAAARTITLPASPAQGDEVAFMDAGGAFGVNALTVARNGQTIMGLAEDMTVSTSGASFSLVFNGTTWRLA